MSSRSASLAGYPHVYYSETVAPHDWGAKARIQGEFTRAMKAAGVVDFIIVDAGDSLALRLKDDVNLEEVLKEPEDRFAPEPSKPGRKNNYPLIPISDEGVLPPKLVNAVSIENYRYVFPVIIHEWHNPVVRERVKKDILYNLDLVNIADYKLLEGNREFIVRFQHKQDLENFMALTNNRNKTNAAPTIKP